MQTERYALADAQWGAPRPLLPPGRPTGGPPGDHRLVLGGIPWVLHPGATWRDLPDRFGPWRTAFHRFNRYREEGVWARVLEALTRSADLGHSQRSVDGTVVRAQRSAAGAEKNAAARRAG